MSRDECIVEEPAPEWFGEQSRVAQTLTPTLSQVERERPEAMRRLNPAIPDEASGSHKESLSVQVNRRPTP
jgi:hypothetical protein